MNTESSEFPFDDLSDFFREIEEFLGQYLDVGHYLKIQAEKITGLQQNITTLLDENANYASLLSAKNSAKIAMMEQINEHDNRVVQCSQNIRELDDLRSKCSSLECEVWRFFTVH